MHIFIIEDEKPAQNRLIQMAQAFDNSIKITGIAGSIKDALQWLEKHETPDLMLVDIQLSDGLSFKIFEQKAVQCPLIFTTAYDEFILQALQHNGIDYLLKPIKKEQLHQALAKYQRLRKHFTSDIRALLQDLKGTKSVYKNRFTVKKGLEFFSIKVEEIAFFYTEHKLVFLMKKDTQKFLLDRPLYEIEKELNPKFFFRVNRKFIASIDAIARFKPFHKGKLLLELVPVVKEQVIISQERASIFKAWLEQ